MDAKQLKQLRKAVAYEPRVYRSLAIVSIVLTVLTLGAMALLFGTASAMLGPSHPAMNQVLIAIPVALSVISTLLMLLIVRRTTDAIINQRLIDLHCPWCNYDLRGIEADHCPECGRETSLA